MKNKRVDSEDRSQRQNLQLSEVLVSKAPLESCGKRVKPADSQVPSPFTLIKAINNEA